MSLYGEDDLLPLSALQHLLFCERQCALIHVEQQWDENRYTAEGRILHERVDIGRTESRGALRLAFGVAIRSLRLGLIGKADVVEFHLKKTPNGTSTWRPFPVEYKRGRQKKKDWDMVQLCAQAICLEEMLSVEVPEGAFFYGKARRRTRVVFEAKLRRKTEETACPLHQLFGDGRTPPPIYASACDRCSFVEACLPHALDGRQSVHRYLKEVIHSK
jgi:CRISPR-associated exonuclease Cas4